MPDGLCANNAAILKQIVDLTAQCQARVHHAKHAAHHHEGHQHGLVGTIVHSWHHLLVEFSELITVIFQTLAVLTLAAGGLTAFIIAVALAFTWLKHQIMATLRLDMTADLKSHAYTRKLAKLRQKLCGSIALGLNFLLAAEVTEQLASGHKGSATEMLTEAVGFLIMVVVRGLIGYEASKEFEEAKEVMHELGSVTSMAPAGPHAHGEGYRKAHGHAGGHAHGHGTVLVGEAKHLAPANMASPIAAVASSRL